MHVRLDKSSAEERQPYMPLTTRSAKQIAEAEQMRRFAMQRKHMIISSSSLRQRALHCHWLFLATGLARHKTCVSRRAAAASHSAS